MYSTLKGNKLSLAQQSVKCAVRVTGPLFVLYPVLGLVKDYMFLITAVGPRCICDTYDVGTFLVCQKHRISIALVINQRRKWDSE